MITSATLRFMVLVSVHDIEILSVDVFYPELVLSLKENHRPTTDWFVESFGEEDLRYLLPDNLELCEEPILFEALGTYTIEGHTDYYGEYDEDTCFEMDNWVAEFPEDNPWLVSKDYEPEVPDELR